MPTKILQCRNSIPCLGIDGEDGDWPIRNLSAEAPDVPLYYCNLYASKPVTLGGNCTVFSAMAIAASSVSQANACALAQLIVDSVDPCPVIPGGGGIDGDPPPPTVPCPLNACPEGQQCVQGECQPFQPVNDFAPVGINPRRAGLALVIGPLNPNKCCVDTVFNATLTCLGFEPFLWSLSGGALPPGLSLSTDGIIAGTATTAGSYDFQVQVQDASGGQGTKNLTIRVVDITSTSPLPDGTVLQAYSQTLQQTGGLPPISWQIADGVLPPGLSLDESTGIISGTPPALVSGQPNEGGTYNFTVSIQDQAT